MGKKEKILHTKNYCKQLKVNYLLSTSGLPQRLHTTGDVRKFLSFASPGSKIFSSNLQPQFLHMNFATFINTIPIECLFIFRSSKDP